MSFKTKSAMKKKQMCQSKIELLEEKYEKIKEILKGVLKDLNNEKEKREILQKEYLKLVEELQEKDHLLGKMQSVSEAVVDEFSVLKVKCELEAEAANNAIKRATKYFQENQKLKKTSEDNESMLNSNKFQSTEDVSETEILNEQNSALRTEIAFLKTKLAKEEQEQLALKEDLEYIKNLYDNEVEEHKSTIDKLKSLELLYNSLIQEDKKVISECSSISKNAQETENNLSHIDCSNGKILNNDENDLIHRLADVEKENQFLRSRVEELEQNTSDNISNEVVSAPLNIPPPPPLPPPPPPSFNPLKSLITFINAGRKSSKKAADVIREDYDTGQQKAMSEMITAIKKGNIQLKPVSKVPIVKEEKLSEPIALIEMKNILKSLKRREQLGKEIIEDKINENTELQIKNNSETETDFCNNKTIETESTFENTCNLNIQESESRLNTEKNLDVHPDNDQLCNGISHQFADSNKIEVHFPEILSEDSNEQSSLSDESVMII